MDFKSLKNFNLQKLKEIDFKDIDLQQLRNIDAQQVQAFLKRYIDYVANVTAVLLAIFVCVQLFKGYSKTAAEVKGKINTEQSLVMAVEKNKSLLSAYNDMKTTFKGFLPGDEIITEISKIAVDADVQIEKLTPRSEKQSELLQASYLDLEISSTDYGAITKFTQGIEKLDKSIRIEKWSAKSKIVQNTATAGSGRARSGGRGSQEPETIEKIILTLTLSSINLLQ